MKAAEDEETLTHFGEGADEEETLMHFKEGAEKEETPTHLGEAAEGEELLSVHHRPLYDRHRDACGWREAGGCRRSAPRGAVGPAAAGIGRGAPAH